MLNLIDIPFPFPKNVLVPDPTQFMHALESKSAPYDLVCCSLGVFSRVLNV